MKVGSRRVVGIAGLATAWLLGASCSTQDRETPVGDGGRNDAGSLTDARADLDATRSAMPDATGATIDSGPATDHCAVPGQVQNAAAGFCQCPVRLPDECPAGCVDLQHDGEHCGECDNACEPGAGCRNGVCSGPPVEVGTLAGCVHPRMILSDETFYFSDTGTGKISSMPLAGGSVTEIATGEALQNPNRVTWTSAIAVDVDSIYWSNMGDRTIRKVPLSVPSSGGTPQVLIELDAAARGLAVGEGMVFFTQHADVFKIPTDGLAADAGAGTPPAALDCGDAGPTPMLGEPVVGATYVASSNESCIPNGEVAAIALTEDEIVYTIDVHGALSQNSQHGGAHLPLVLGDDVGPTRDVIALDATHAFVAGYSSVLKAQMGEAAMYEAVVYAVDSGIATGFTVTQTHVYVASDRGGISRASINPPTDNSLAVSEQLVRDQATPRWLVNDGTHLYWITSDCRIMSVAMPP